MNFHKIKLKHFDYVCLKLTIFYLLIVMTISLIFSFVLYNISFSELDRGLVRQTRILKELPTREFLPKPLQNLDEFRFKQLQESNSRLKLNLIYFNLFIFIISGFTSYFLAKKTLEPIKEMVNAQNCFTADASHELRTPLTAMRSEIEVGLRDRNFNLVSAKKLLTSNLEEIEKLESLSNSLLKLTGYQEKEILNFHIVSLEDIVVEAYQKVSKLAENKSIVFETILKDIKIKGDKQSLVELFLIILENAIKYSPEGSKIFINIENEGDKSVVKIKDQGIGIKSSDIPFIFNRFYRSDSSRAKDKVAGYGLGLSIAKRIADLHNGEIFIESILHRGSEFIIKFKSLR